MLRFDRKKPISFRRQLFSILSFSGVILAVSISFAFAWLSNKNITDIYKTQALQATETLAKMSELALLFGSEENALEVVDATLGYPAIRYVQLVNSESNVILSRGTWSRPVSLLSHQQMRAGKERLIEEKNNAWHFAAPVFTEGYEQNNGNDLIADHPDSDREYLGYVYVIQDMSEQQQAQYRVFFSNVIIGLFFSAMLVLLTHFSLKQLLRPMDQLSEAMNYTKQGEARRIESLQGPKEILDIIEVYNRMIDALRQRDLQLREHNEQLEIIVERRTQELQQARDEALDASRMKSMFLATMSHELKTPLNSILGYSDTLKDALDQEGFFDLSDEFDRIIINAEFLLALINNILNVVRAESGRLKLELQEVDIEHLLEKVKTNIQPLIEKNNNHLAIKLGSNTRLLIMDETKLQQILVNLLSNATKFTHNGDITLEITVSDSLLTFSVSDTGIGIDAEQLQFVFDPFRQIDNRLERYYEGSGLGLSIVKYFCDLMGGTITVESTPDYGSTFRVHIPLPLLEHAAKSQSLMS